MKDENVSKSFLMAFIIFWLGVLTGALIVGLAFSYRTVPAADVQSSLLTLPGSYQYYIPTPTGNYQYIPTPTGNINTRLSIPTPPGN